MRCPACNHLNYIPTEACPACQFSGDPALVEELDRLNWLLAEIDGWAGLGVINSDRQKIQQFYQRRRDEIEIALKLRPPPLSKEEVKQLWIDLFQREALLKKIPAWVGARLLNETAAQTLLDQLGQQIEDLQAQLADHPRPVWPQTDADRLLLTQFFLDAVDHLDKNGGFPDFGAKAMIRAPLLAEAEGLEIALGLRPKPAPQPVVKPQPPAKAPAQKIVKAAKPPPPKPALPLTERIWRTLLSERTLQAVLFLGIFLLFAAALSFVLWGWKNFSAPLRVAIPTGFTLLFFALGRYVQSKTTLRRSGMALSAIAALLVPIDFYTLYANAPIPPDFGPSFWLLASLISAAAYLAAAYIIKSRFFGYLITAALGSATLASVQLGHQFLGLSLDWRSASLSLLALALFICSEFLVSGFRVSGFKFWVSGYDSQSKDQNPETQNMKLKTRNTLLVEPFRYTALIAAATLMLLALGMNYVIGPPKYNALYQAMTVSWWIGGVIFGWGAVIYLSRSLGILAALSLPAAAYFTQAALFYHAQIKPAWHAFGLALLVSLYFSVAYKLLNASASQQEKEETRRAVLRQHGQTALIVGLTLLAIAALWPFTDLSSAAPAAASHAALMLSAGLAFRLWKKPHILYGASFFALSALTFSLTWLGLSLWQLSPGWDTLALAHLFAALGINSKFKKQNVKFSFTAPLVVAGYAIAALALLPPLFLNKSSVLIYALGLWLGMSAWGARLAYIKEPGFVPKYRWADDIYHWLTAIPLPLWLLLLFAEIRPLDGSFALALAVLTWGMIGLSYRLKHCAQQGDLLYLSWYVVGLLAAAVAPIAAAFVAPGGFALPLTLALTGALYLSDAFISRRAWLHIPGGLLLAAGWSLFFERWGASFAAVTFALACITGAYFAGGLWVERKRSPVFTYKFLAPLYAVGHFLTLFALARIYAQPLDSLFFHHAWTDAMQLWGAASQLLLGAVYGLFAWGRHQERWAHLAVWLGATSGGLAAIAFSKGHGISAAEAALMATLLVLAERGLHRMSEWANGESANPPIRLFAHSQILHHLYRRPLLIAGWTISAATIVLALFRNLWLLGGGSTQKFWAWVGLLIIVGLYALSARLFRRALFVWLTAILLIAPWTILTNLGWYTAYRPTTPGYALSWAVLAWLLFLVSSFGFRVSGFKFRVSGSESGASGYDLESNEQVTQSQKLETKNPKLETKNPKPETRNQKPNYALPLNITAHVLLVFSLLWGIADVDTSRFTFELAIGLYAVAALLMRRQYGEKASRLRLTGFLYPALGLVPVWSVYLMAWLLPAARREHYGLMLLLFAPIGLATGHWLKRFGADQKRAAAYALPAYLTAFAALIVGTMLTAHLSALLAMVLLYDALLLIFSARYFANPLWLYPATALAPVALLIALSARGTTLERRGWWVIGLGAVYLALAAALRRVNLRAYGTAPLAAGLALIALGLLPSSLDQTGALWGYGSAALLYALTAAWLKQPLLLTPASALIIVPYAIMLQRSSLLPAYYGLALFPGAIAALILGWRLDNWQVGGGVEGRRSRGVGGWRSSSSPAPPYSLTPLLAWWGLPLYALGFGLAMASPFFTAGRSDLAALNLLLLVPVFGWGIYRFRRRVYLLAAAAAGHLAMIVWLAYGGWWAYPAHAWLRFTPVTWLTALLAIYLSWRLDEGSPLDTLFTKTGRQGWSRPLYLLLFLDVTAAQFGSFAGSGDAASWVTLNHLLLLALLSVVLADFWLPYAATALGLLFTGQRLFVNRAPAHTIPPMLALLSLGYGIIGYALTVIRRRLPADRQFRDGLAVWETPMQFSGLIISAGTLLATAILSLNLVGWTVRAIFGFPFRQLVDPATVLMAVQVLSYLGLLYLTAAVVRRQVRIAYASVAMLLGAWMLYVFYIQEWAGLHKVQWYAAPAGLYLLAIGWQEWRQGHKSLGRWIDYAATLLMLGSLFWQTLVLGWAYFGLLMLEGLLFVWWGSARRLRRFLYAGLMGVVLATTGQLVNAALSFINQWVVFGLIGLLLIVGAVLVERKLEDLKVWQDSLEEWE